MSFSSANLAAIDAAIARGERSVQFADRTVTYRSTEELLQARREILAEMSRAARRPKQFRAVANDGHFSGAQE